jgi:hypothetical protein
VVHSTEEITQLGTERKVHKLQHQVQQLQQQLAVARGLLQEAGIAQPDFVRAECETIAPIGAAAAGGEAVAAPATAAAVAALEEAMGEKGGKLDSPQPHKKQ